MADNQPRPTASRQPGKAAPAETRGESRDPVPVIIVEDRDTSDNPPLRMFAVLIFFGTLLGSLIGAVADFGQATETLKQFGEIFNPPPDLCIVGSDTILGADLNMAQTWAADFEQTRNLRLSIDAIGSGNGVRRAAEGGCAHVLAMSEAMTDEQYTSLQAAGLEVECATEIGYDIIAFVTDINNRVPVLLQRNLSQILDGRTTNWSQVGGPDQTIYILARPGSGTTAHVLSRVANYPDDGTFPWQANYLPCPDNANCLDMTLATPGALYWVSTAWMRTKPPRYLRVLPILRGDERAINPLTDTYELVQYPSALVRPLYMYVLSGSKVDVESHALAREFLTYVRGVAGQQILENARFITYFDSTANIPIELPPGFTVNEGVREVCRNPA